MKNPVDVVKDAYVCERSCTTVVDCPTREHRVVKVDLYTLTFTDSGTGCTVVAYDTFRVTVFRLPSADIPVITRSLGGPGMYGGSVVGRPYSKIQSVSW